MKSRHEGHNGSSSGKKNENEKTMKIKGLSENLPKHLEYKNAKFQPNYPVKKDMIYGCLAICCQFDNTLKSYRVFFTYYDPYDKYIYEAPKELFEVIDDSIPEFWKSKIKCGNNLFEMSDPDLLKYPNLGEHLLDSEPDAVAKAKIIIARHKLLW